MGTSTTISNFTEIDTRTPHSDAQQSLKFSNQHSFSKAELEQCSAGLLFGESNAQLPTAPLLMLDRIIDIRANGGLYERGYAVAELELNSSSWFFKHHFQGDPVMPGCLLIEAMWQLTGFHLAWSGYKGKGRVLGSGKTRFIEPVINNEQTLNISIHVRRVIVKASPISIAYGEVRADYELKCKSDAIKIGLFP